MKNQFILLGIAVLILACSSEPKTIKLSGAVFGTNYNIQYYDKTDISYQNQIDSLFAVVNQSMSTYMTDSDISKLNRGEIFKVDDHFLKVLETSKQIFKETNGAFDPTIGNVVNAWDFGPDKNKFLTDSLTIKNLMVFVGLDKVIVANSNVLKPGNTFLDFNAIAKGYGIDVIGDFLSSKGIENYLVDIGGDLRTSGKNIEKNKGWTVGIDDPNFDGSRSHSKVVVLQNEGMATSGTYRKFKTDENGNRYAHIINTKTGYPTKTNILSVSVRAPNCMLADAYATAFQAMGIERVKVFLKSHPELKVFIIYLDEANKLKTLGLNAF